MSRNLLKEKYSDELHVIEKSETTDLETLDKVYEKEKMTDTEYSKKKKTISDKYKKEKFKLSNRSFKLKDDDVNFLQKLFKYLGIPYFKAKGEADILCAQMVNHGYAEACITQDMDLFAFSCKKVLRDLNSKGTAKLYTLKDILKGFKINYEQLVDLSILLGCDYLETIPTVGTKRAYDLILKYKSIGEILSENTKYKKSLSNDYYERVKTVRDLFNLGLNKPKELIDKKVNEVIREIGLGDKNLDKIINLVKANVKLKDSRYINLKKEIKELF